VDTRRIAVCASHAVIGFEGISLQSRRRLRRYEER
jgi:hypothetical protein